MSVSLECDLWKSSRNLAARKGLPELPTCCPHACSGACSATGPNCVYLGEDEDQSRPTTVAGAVQQLRLDNIVGDRIVAAFQTRLGLSHHV